MSAPPATGPLKNPARSSEAPSPIASTQSKGQAPSCTIWTKMLWITHGCVCCGQVGAQECKSGEGKSEGGTAGITGFGEPPASFPMHSHSVDGDTLPWSLCNVPRGVLILLFFSAFSQQSTLKKNPMAMNSLVAFTLYLMATEILRMPLHVPNGVGEMPFHTAKRCCCLKF